LYIKNPPRPHPKIFYIQNNFILIPLIIPCSFNTRISPWFMMIDWNLQFPMQNNFNDMVLHLCPPHSNSKNSYDQFKWMQIQQKNGKNRVIFNLFFLRDVTLLLFSKHSNVMMTNFQTWIVELFNAPQNFHNWYEIEMENEWDKHMGILRMVSHIILDKMFIVNNWHRGWREIFSSSW